MKINSVLLSGAGNTFHLIDDQDQKKTLDVLSKKQLAVKMCKTNPADGVIFLRTAKDSQNTYEWSFYNNDGSDAEMCGNATRCVGYYIKNILQDDANEWFLNTVAGRIHIKALSAEKFEIEMTAITEMPSKHGFFCNTGVPHLVLEIENFENYRNLKEHAKTLRTHSDFQPSGTNVTFVAKTNSVNYLKAVSFERGVEDFTEACGTGAMAAAFYNLKKNNCAKTDVEMPGGTLMMDVSNPQQPIMIGPARMLGKFVYEA